MTDAISNHSRVPTGNTTLRSVSDLSTSGSSSKSGSSTNSAPAPAPTPTASLPSAGADTVSLSNVSLQIAQQSGFDQGKVSSIKQAIQNGDYAIDPRRIAQGFTSLEKLIRE